MLKVRLQAYSNIPSGSPLGIVSEGFDGRRDPLAGCVRNSTHTESSAWLEDSQTAAVHITAGLAVSLITNSRPRHVRIWSAGVSTSLPGHPHLSAARSCVMLASWKNPTFYISRNTIGRHAPKENSISDMPITASSITRKAGRLASGLCGPLWGPQSKVVA